MTGGIGQIGALPTALPSALPSASPSTLPSALPSTLPSTLPSSLPSALPTALPAAVNSLRDNRSLSVLLAVLFALGLLAVAASLVYFLRYRRRQGAVTAAGGAVDRRRLVRVVQAFRQQLPGSVREALPSCGHFLVLGAAGVGKSTLIARLTDWQAQASQFLPSYTADPLLQIYLSRQLVAYELSAALLSASTREASVALRELFLGFQGGLPPTAVVVLSLASLRDATPDRLRQQAQLVRGKLNLLAEVQGAPVRTRICVTGMDRLPGYSPLARFLRQHDIDYAPELGARARRDAAEAFEGCTPHLPRVLTSQPVAGFDSVVALLATAGEHLRPLSQFLDELTEPSLAGACPELDRLYFFAPATQEQLASPFVAPPQTPRRLRRRDSWRRLLSLDGRIESPGHALAALLLLLLLFTGAALATHRHAQTVDGAKVAVRGFSQTLGRTAGEIRSSLGGSDLLLQRAYEAGQRLETLSAAESRLRPLGWLYRDDKATLRDEYTAALRRGYLLPLLQTAVRQRSREKILYALAALYATPGGALGALLRTQAAEFQSRIGLPERVASDYLRWQASPYSEPALTTLPPLDEDLPLAQRQAVETAQPWLRFLNELSTALTRPSISPAELEPLRSQVSTLRAALALGERATGERQLYHLLSAEAPLDMARLFGRSAQVLNPALFLTDNREALSGLLTFIDESSKNYSRNDRVSLYRLLKWINELGQRSAVPAQEYAIVIDDRAYRIRQQAWLDLLFRSRKRALTGGLASGSQVGQREKFPSKKTPCRGKDCGDARCRSLPRRENSENAGSQRPIAQRCENLNPRARRQPRSGGAEVFSPEELLPKVASLYIGDSPPPPNVSEVYNRSLLNKELLPLLQELRQALSSNSALSPEEKLALSRVVGDEVRTYARSYCAALKSTYDAYDGFPGSVSLPELRTALLGMAAPGAPFVEHLRTIADNTRIEGLNEPYLRPLHECLRLYRPLAALVEPGKEGDYPGLKPYRDLLAQLATGLTTAPGPTTTGPSPAAPAVAAPASNAGAATAASGTAAATPPGSPAANNKESTLLARLPPVARLALELQGAAPQRAAFDRFLDEAGIAHPLRRPFLRPLAVVYRRGLGELEAAMARHAREEIAPPLQQILASFPFNRRSRSEVELEKLEQLNPLRGALWTHIQRNYIEPGFLQERGGELVAPTPQSPEELAPPRLGREWLALFNHALRLSRLLFREDGTRQPLRLRVRALPIPTASSTGLGAAGRSPQPALSFLSVGKAQIFGFNQQESSKPLDFEWWTTSTAAVGVEYTPTDATRSETRSLEIGDTTWPLYRLLQRAAITDDAIVYFQLARESETSRWSLGFVFDPEPWSLLSPQRTPAASASRSTP